MTRCPQCGRGNRADARYCDACGTSLGPSPAPREERKVVTVLFADLVGFTATAERLDPEDVRALQDPYWRHVRTEIERHGGTVEKFIGDAVVALFGAPLAHEDDPERAVRAALAIRDWAQEQTEIQVRIGITTGEALIRLVAQPLAGEGMASGDVVNTAARLQAAATANAILVDRRSYRATRQVIDYREAGSVEAKGKAKPIRVWEARQARSRFGVDLFQHARTPLVGRERELDLLRSALQRVLEEHSPQLITLVGVPGIGKSRLVYELMRAIADDPSGFVTWRQGRSLPYGDGVSFWALAEIVKAQAGILETDSETEAHAKLGRAVQILIDAVSEAEWVERHLAPLAGFGGDTEFPTDRSEAFAAWRRFFEALADWRPTVLVLEDLHWADEGLLDFVDSLIEWVGDVPLLVVATARPELLERRPSWGGGKANATTLTLSPLADAETARLIAELAGRPQLPPGTWEVLLAHAAGNALYAEEYVRLWEEHGHAEQLPLPETVHGLIAARLDNLSPAEKSVLQHAAVFGKVFWQGAIVAVDGIDVDTTAGCLRALQRKQFVQRARRSSVEAETEYAFGHVLVRDVAYSQIPRAARADMHERAAAWIESLGRPDDHAEMLAHHYLRALDLASATGRETDEIATQALSSVIRAGDRAFALSAFPSAMAYYERALQLLPENDSRGPQLLFANARALFATGDEQRVGALEDARAALLAAGDIERAAEAEALLADVWFFQGDRTLVDRHLERALALVRECEASPAKARVLAAAARFRMLAEQPGAVEVAHEAVALGEALQLPETEADGRITLGTAKWNAGDTGGASDIEHGLRIALEHNALAAAQRGYNNLAFVMGGKGEAARRIDLLHESARIARRLGDRDRLRYVNGQIIGRKFNLGWWDGALREADEFIAECETGSPHVQEATAREIRARIRLARDDVDGALSDYRRALALMREAEDPQMVVPMLVAGMRLYARLGRFDEARSLADEAQTYDPAIAAKYLLLPLAWLKNELDVAEEELARYRPYVPTDLPWVEIEQLLSSDRFDEAADRVAELGLISQEAEDNERAATQLLKQGRYDQARERLERALAFYRSVGATRYIREVEALLAASGPEEASAAPRPT